MPDDELSLQETFDRIANKNPSNIYIILLHSTYLRIGCYQNLRVIGENVDNLQDDIIRIVEEVTERNVVDVESLTKVSGVDLHQYIVCRYR